MTEDRQPPLYLDLPFGEALERFLQTDPKEVESLRQKKTAKPKPGGHLEDGEAPKGETD